LADVLRKEIDPLPAFVAEMFEHNGKPVGVMRIFESADAPHIVRGTGAVYVRSSKGKEPVNDHRTLLAIAQKGEQAEALASERMRTLPSVAEALTTGEEDLEIVFTARAAPVTMNPAASDWVLTRAGEHAVVESADRLLPGPPPPQPGSLQIGRREGPVVLPFGRAVSATVRQSGLFQEARTAVVVADSGGVFAAQLRTGPESAPQQREDVEHSFLVDAIFESDLRPLARCFADLLASGEVYGRALLNLTIAMPPATSIYQARRMTPPTEPLFSSGELTIPADQDEVDALAEYWDRELHRQLGVARYEGEPRAS
jgi:hypothetical protein